MDTRFRRAVARLRREPAGARVAFPSLAFAAADFAVVAWLLSSDPLDAEELGRYGPSVAPLFILALGIGALAEGLANLLPRSRLGLVTTLRAARVAATVAAFAIWGVVVWGILVPEG